MECYSEEVTVLVCLVHIVVSKVPYGFFLLSKPSGR